MGIHVPQSLLNVSETIKVKVRLDRITDRQIKNIVRNVKAGYVPLYANSATAHIARHIVETYDVPCVKWSSWRIKTHKISPTHPIWDAVPQAVALSKLETNAQDMDWYAQDYEAIVNAVKDRTKDVSISHYMFREAGSKLLHAAVKGAAVPADHPVHAYLDKLTKREVAYIELETTSL